MIGFVGRLDVKMVSKQNKTDKPIRFKRETLKIVQALFKKRYPDLFKIIRDDAKRINYIIQEWIKQERNSKR